MGWKKLIFGEKMPDKDDPKYKERYERDVAAGRKFAKTLRIDKAALEKIIDEYTHESGVRGLEKQIAKIARVTAKKIALGESYPTVIKKEHLKEYLGLPTNFHDLQKGNEAPGVVTGLAWTQMGGEILFVESSVSGGKGVMTAAPLPVVLPSGASWRATAPR